MWTCHLMLGTSNWNLTFLACHTPSKFQCYSFSSSWNYGGSGVPKKFRQKLIGLEWIKLGWWTWIPWIPPLKKSNPFQHANVSQILYSNFTGDPQMNFFWSNNDLRRALVFHPWWELREYKINPSTAVSQCYSPIILSDVLNWSGCSLTLLSNLSTKSELWMGSFHIGPPRWNLPLHWSHEGPTGGPTAGGYFLLRPSSIRRPTGNKWKKIQP